MSSWCEKELEAVENATTIEEWDLALRKLVLCILSQPPPSGSSERRPTEAEVRWQVLLEALKARIDIPPRPCGLRSLEVRKEIFEDPEKAILFSRTIASAFQESGVQLEADETFACLICVTKKPGYISEVISTAPTGAEGRTQPIIQYIMEPAIMEKAMEVLERERIKYETQAE